MAALLWLMLKLWKSILNVNWIAEQPATIRTVLQKALVGYNWTLQLQLSMIV